MHYVAASHYDHRNSDAFGCAILSHGDNGVVYGTDGILKVEDLCASFRADRCPTLAGKPKLFFIQVCVNPSSAKFLKIHLEIE